MSSAKWRQFFCLHVWTSIQQLSAKELPGPMNSEEQIAVKFQSEFKIFRSETMHLNVLSAKYFQFSSVISVLNLSSLKTCTSGRID